MFEPHRGIFSPVPSLDHRLIHRVLIGVQFNLAALMSLSDVLQKLVEHRRYLTTRKRLTCVHLLCHRSLFLSHRSLSSTVTLGEVVDELTLFPDEDVQVDREELVPNKAFEPISN